MCTLVDNAGVQRRGICKDISQIHKHVWVMSVKKFEYKVAICSPTRAHVITSYPSLTMGRQCIQFFSHPHSGVTLFIYGPADVFERLEELIYSLTGCVTHSLPLFLQDVDEGPLSNVICGQCGEAKTIKQKYPSDDFDEQIFTLIAMVYFYERGLLRGKLRPQLSHHIFENGEGDGSGRTPVETLTVPISRFSRRDLKSETETKSSQESPSPVEAN